MPTISTGNYTVGQVSLYFTASPAHSSLLATDPSVASGLGGAFRTTARAFGNITAAEINPDVTYIEHFISDKGRKKRDKVSANMVSMSVPFTFDEMSAANIQKFFLASNLAAGGRYAVFEKALTEGAAQVFFDTDVGNDIVYFIPNCIIRPDGALSTNEEDWWSGPMVLDILYYENSHWASKPYGFVLASNID